MIRLFIISACLMFGSSSVAQETIHRPGVAGWSVDEVSDGPFGQRCSMSARFSDGTRMYFEVTLRDAQFLVMFKNEDWLSLPSASVPIGQRQYRTRLVWSGTDASPVAADFTAANAAAGPLLFFQTAVSDMQTFLGPMAQASSFRLESRGNVVGNYSMVGSSAATQKLSDCIQGHVDRINSDPFRSRN